MANKIIEPELKFIQKKFIENGYRDLLLKLTKTILVGLGIKMEKIIIKKAERKNTSTTHKKFRNCSRKCIRGDFQKIPSDLRTQEKQ